MERQAGEKQANLRVLRAIHDYEKAVAAGDADPAKLALAAGHSLFDAVEALERIRPFDREGRILWALLKQQSTKPVLYPPKLQKAAYAFSRWFFTWVSVASPLLRKDKTPLPEWTSLPEIFDALGLAGKTREAARKRAERARRQHDADWREIENRRENEPRYVYRTAAVTAWLADLL